MVIFATILAVLLLIWTGLMYVRLRVPGVGFSFCFSRTLPEHSH